MPKEILPTWNLSDLYQGLDDPKITAHLGQLTQQVKSFQNTYEHRITEELSASSLKEALEHYAALLHTIRKLETYAYLEYATNVSSPKHSAFLQKISSQLAEIISHILFFEVNLTKSPLTILDAFIKNPLLKNFQHFLEKQAQQKLHRLSVEGEDVILKKSLTGRQAFSRLYQQQATKQTYYLNSKKKPALTLTQLLSLAHSPKRSERKAAARARHRAHEHDPLHHTFTYNTLIQDWTIDTRLRKFDQPEDVRHLENEITRPMVDTLVDTVVKNYPLVQEYYGLKRKLLGLKKLHDFDKYAPLSQVDKKYTWPEAKQMILNAFTSFSPEFAGIAAKFFEQSWIDAALSPTKQAGAFCHYATPDTHPYVLVNYTGTLNDVSTLAHELGHGIHAYLARQQNILNFDWPLTMAETASVFSEMVIFESLKKNLTNPQEKLALYLSKIDNIWATTARQITMFRFERRAHQLRQQNELTTKQLNDLWLQEQQTMFGSSLSLTEYEQSYWQIIPHIFQSPFYVYTYAFGELLTLSLFRIYKDDPKKFVPKYLKLLSAGGSQPPQELLKPFGVDLADQQFWQNGFDEIKQLIDETKNLAPTQNLPKN